MILKIKEWCEEIVVAVILCIIIESLIPKGNNKKYIKVIIGIYIMYVSVSPFLGLLNYDFNFEKIFAVSNEYEEVSKDIDNNIKDVYISGIEENIKKEIKELGYEIEDVKVSVDINYENIEMIELKLISQQNNNSIVEPIIIDNQVREKQNDTLEIIKQYISDNYSVAKDNIKFK